MNKKLSEKEIDALVIAQANDDDAWEKPIFVNRKKIFSIAPPVKIDKNILSGTPVFEGTRVPVSALLDNLEVGVSLDEFLGNFPTVKREQAVQVLRYLKSSLDDFKKPLNYFQEISRREPFGFEFAFFIPYEQRAAMSAHIHFQTINLFNR